VSVPPDPDRYIHIETNPPQYAPFEQAIGRAITIWQQVEVALCGLFVKVSTCRNQKVASAIFYNFHDFSDKIDLVHCAARLSISATPEFEEWTGPKNRQGLKRRLQEAAELRNSVAHYHLAMQLPGPTQEGIEGPKAQFAILTLSGEGSVITGDYAASDIPPGTRLIYRPNYEDPNQAFKDRPRPTKKPMQVRDVVRAGNRFSTLAKAIKALSESIQPP